MKNYFNNLINRMVTFYKNLNPTKKLLFDFVIVLFLALIFFVTNNIKKNDSLINYKISASSYFNISSDLNDKETFAQVKTIADNFQKEMVSFPDYSINKSEFSNYYNYCVYSKYKNVVSKKEFYNKSRDFLNKTLSEDGIIEYIDDIGVVNDNFYMVRYLKKVDDEDVYSYLGIALDSGSNRYYIWYIE